MAECDNPNTESTLSMLELFWNVNHSTSHSDLNDTDRTDEHGWLQNRASFLTYIQTPCCLVRNGAHSPHIDLHFTSSSIFLRSWNLCFHSSASKVHLLIVHYPWVSIFAYILICLYKDSFPGFRMFACWRKVSHASFFWFASGISQLTL